MTKNFPGKAFELLATLRIQFQIANTCNKKGFFFFEKIKFWPATLQDSTSPNVLKFWVCISVAYIAGICILLSQMKQVYWPFFSQNTVFSRVTQHGKFVSWQPIRATTNLPSYRSEDLFSENRSEGHLGHLPSYTEDLFSYANSWPFAIAKLQTFFPDDAGFSYLLSRVAGENIWSFEEMYHAYSNLYVTSCTRSWCGRAKGGGGGEWGNISVRTQENSRYKLDWGCVTLRERQTMANKKVKPVSAVWMGQISPDPSLLPIRWPVKKAFADAYPQV